MVDQQHGDVFGLDLDGLAADFRWGVTMPVMPITALAGPGGR